jgi:hypothetical protein
MVAGIEEQLRNRSDDPGLFCLFVAREAQTELRGQPRPMIRVLAKGEPIA